MSIEQLRDQLREEEVLQAMGRLSLAAGGAEMAFAEALHYLLTDNPVATQEGAGKIAKALRSMDVLHRLLMLAMPDPQPLGEMFAKAQKIATAPAYGLLGVTPIPRFIGRALDNSWVRRFLEVQPDATAADYLKRVKSLYDKRNECMHAFELELVDGVAHLTKPSDAGLAVIEPSHLMEPCILLRHEGVRVGEAMMLLAAELSLASLPAVQVASGLRWYRVLTARRAAHEQRLGALGFSAEAIDAGTLAALAEDKGDE